jgi:hypothetical protein
MPLLSAEQLWRKYGHFAKKGRMYNLLAEAVNAGALKREVEAVCIPGHYVVAGYCELCFCKHVYATRHRAYAAKLFALNVSEIRKVIAMESK